MKKRSALVFTGLLETWFKSYKNILIGECCTVKDINNKKYQNFDTEISDGEKKEDIIKDSKICNYYYERLLNDVIFNLKDIYDVNWNKRSWEIFLGPWIHRYVATIYDRFYSLDYVLNKYDIQDIKVNTDVKFKLLTQDQLDFRQITQSDEWNFKLFSKLYLQFFHNKKIKLHKIKLRSKKYSVKNNFSLKMNFIIILVNKFKKFILKCLKNYTKIIFYRTYFGNKKFILSISLINKNIPFIYDFNHKLPNTDYIHSIRKSKFYSNYKINKFEKALRDLFFELLPFYYLEKFSYLKNLSKNLFLPSTKKRKVYTAGGLWYDDIFKFWLADSISNKSKLFYFQHGCNYGTTKYSYCEDLEIKLSDKFYTWGWKNKLNKTKKFLSIKLLGKKKFNSTNLKNTLVVGSCPLIYKSANTSGITYGRKSRIYINSVINLLSDFSKNMKHDVFFRPFPIENYNKEIGQLNLENYTKKNFKLIKINNPKKNFYDSLKDFGLVVHTLDGTAFFETMGLNKPSILFMPKEYSHQRKSAVYYYNRLKEANILHSNSQSLIKFLNKINLNKWWYKKKTQLIRDEFCKEFCYHVENPIKEFSKKIL